MVFVTSIETAIQFIAEENDRLKERLEGELPRPKPIEDYKAILGSAIFQQKLHYIENNGITSERFQDVHARIDTHEKLRTRREAIIRLLDHEKAKAEEISARNQIVIEHNKTVVAKITDLMTAMGISPTYSTTEYKRGKAVAQKHSAGYTQDIARHIKTIDGFSAVVAQINNVRRTLDEWARTKHHELDQQIAAKKLADREQAQMHFLATMRVRYGLDYDASDDEVLNAIVGSDKYLRLAHLMQQCRINGGKSFAQHGVDSFPISSETDEQIVADVQLAISRWDGDGRIFRDGRWGYEAVFTLAAEQSLADYNAFVDLYPRF